MENRGNIADYLDLGSRKSSSNSKDSLIGKLYVLAFVIMALVMLCTILDVDFADALLNLVYLGVIPLAIYLKGTMGLAPQNMTEDQRKAYLLAMAKEEEAEERQHKLMIYGGVGACFAVSGLFVLMNSTSSGALINGLIMIIGGTFVAVAFITTATKNLGEFKQILAEEAAGKLDYLKQLPSNDQSNFIPDETFDRSPRPNRGDRATSYSENSHSEAPGYDNIQF